VVDLDFRGGQKRDRLIEGLESRQHTMKNLYGTVNRIRPTYWGERLLEQSGLCNEIRGTRVVKGGMLSRNVPSQRSLGSEAPSPGQEEGSVNFPSSQRKNNSCLRVGLIKVGLGKLPTEGIGAY